MQNFINSVWKWKYSAIFSWVLTIYLVYILSAEFLRHYLVQPYPLGSYLSPVILISVCIPLYFYSKSLCVVPIRKNVIPLMDMKYPALFFLTQFIWCFFHLFMYLSPKLSLQISACFLIVFYLFLDFTIVLLYDKKNRIENIKTHCLYCIPISPIFASFAICYFTFDLYVSIIVSSTLFLSLFFISICSLICGEKTSFAKSDDASRLADGLERRSLVEQYWAYSDFLDIASDKVSSRRNFIYEDAGKTFSRIVKSIITKISDMSEAHDSLSTNQKSNSSSNSSHYPSLKVFIQRQWTNFLGYMKGRHIRQMTMKKERKASENSIIVMNGIQSLVKMMFLAKKEDKYGIVQVHAEEIVNAIISLHRSVDRSHTYIWKTPSFGKQWIADDYQDLALQVLRVTNWAITNLILKYGKKLDLEMLSNENSKYVIEYIKNTLQMSEEEYTSYFTNN
ncbi:hypothetical protein TRFO_21368 [Tritrichomonas foetus]|uniref:Uncharacterized protein n=1 Tax=Tritrichomonas foetus TaxID=1144522 RepID=A0A1J4KEM4_9EUKA|nr:hypothetical protein TRFO_21368 [Tritrichomonas foetus]|eukprot:OHT09651.1 hypothetical protein TRFO_21368 [Tritrichomonas foetus]